MGKTELYARLQRQTRKTMLKAGKELEEEFRKRLLELEKEIVHQLIKQPKTEFEAWNLLQVWKSIEDSIGRWKKEAWLPTVEKHVKKTFREAEKHALKVLEELLGKEELQKEPPFNLLPEESLKFVLKFPFHFAGKFADDLKERIREKLFTGIAMGKSYLEIAREIDLLGIPTVKPFKNSWERAQTIARTEVARAYHMGTLMTYQRLGVEEIKIICGSSPCNLCLSHCATIKPISYADYVLKHPNCTCTYVAAKWKGKVLEERDYKRAKELTEIKEYTLEKSKGFMKKVLKEFSQPLPDDLLIQKFQGFFKKEKDFYRHLFKHGIPEEWKLQVFREASPNLSWKEVKDILQTQYQVDFIRFAKQYITEMLEALAHVSRTFYDLPFEGAKPTITMFSGYHRRVVVTFDGDKLQSVYTIRGKLADYINERREKSHRFEEVGIDDEIRALARKIRDLHKRFGGNT
jgi:hypothetical protein